MDMAVEALIAQEVALHTGDFSPQGLANVGWAFATVGLRHQRLMDAISKALQDGGASNWTQQNMANIMWAFAKLLVQPSRESVEAIAWDVVMTVRAWSALNLANMTWAFAKLTVRHTDFFDAVEGECLQK
ncbi:unnamed protein product, partial [Polarella glacialis]